MWQSTACSYYEVECINSLMDRGMVVWMGYWSVPGTRVVPDLLVLGDWMEREESLRCHVDVVGRWKVGRWLVGRV